VVHDRVIVLQTRGILGQSQAEHLLKVASTLEPRGDWGGGAEDEQLALEIYAGRSSYFTADEVDRLLAMTERLWPKYG
jgi:hypothetical protein